MPDLVVHNSMGDHVLQKLPPEITAAIDSDAFHVGVLGPDPYFFYRFFALPFANGVDKRGSTMHHKRCGAFLLALARETTSSYLGQGKLGASDKLGASNFGAPFSYFLGFLCHYAMDSTAHPYINALAAKRPGMHTAIERKLDRIELKRLGKQLKDIPSYLCRFPQVPELRRAMKEVYGWDDDKFLDGYRHMKAFQWFIKDQHGVLAVILQALAGVIALITGKKADFIRALSYRNHMADDLELDRFDALEHEAVGFAVELITAAVDFRAGVITEQNLAEVIGNRAYSGGAAED